MYNKFGDFMKKFIFLLVSLFAFVMSVNADGFVTYTSYVSKCAFLNHKMVVVPVRVVSVDNGALSNNISNYFLGDIDVNSANVKIEEVEGNGILNVGLKDPIDGISKIYFTLNKDIELNNVDDILSFNIIYDFKDKVPNSINVLGNDIVISDNKNICDKLNSFDINDLSNQSIISENKINNKYYLYNGLVIFLFILILLSTILVLKKKKKI